VPLFVYTADGIKDPNYLLIEPAGPSMRHYLQELDKQYTEYMQNIKQASQGIDAVNRNSSQEPLPKFIVTGKSNVI